MEFLHSSRTRSSSPLHGTNMVHPAHMANTSQDGIMPYYTDAASSTWTELGFAEVYAELLEAALGALETQSAANARKVPTMGGDLTGSTSSSACIDARLKAVGVALGESRRTLEDLRRAAGDEDVESSTHSLSRGILQTSQNMAHSSCDSMITTGATLAQTTSKGAHEPNPAAGTFKQGFAAGFAAGLQQAPHHLGKAAAAMSRLPKSSPAPVDHATLALIWRQALLEASAKIASRTPLQNNTPAATNVLPRNPTHTVEPPPLPETPPRPVRISR